MASFDQTTRNIVLSRAGDFLLPMWIRSASGTFIDASNDSLVLRVQGGFELAGIPHPDHAGWKLFHFTAAHAISLPDFAVPYLVVWTPGGNDADPNNNGSPSTLFSATITAEDFA